MHEKKWSPQMSQDLTYTWQPKYDSKASAFQEISGDILN